MNCWSDQNLHFAHQHTLTFMTHSNKDLDCETLFNPETDFHGVCSLQRLDSVSVKTLANIPSWQMEAGKLPF